MNEELQTAQRIQPAQQKYKTEMRLARNEELERLKLIWKLCFGDEDQYIDAYFDKRNWTEETAVFLKDNQIVSMLAMIPADLNMEDGSRKSTAMIYAVATHPEHQKMGIADELLRFANEYLASKQTDATFLVPADEGLFRFYRKRGYQEAFFLRQREFSWTQARELEVPDRLSLKFKAAEPSEYNTARRRFLSGSTYIDYRAEEISHQKQISNQGGGDIYLIQWDATAAEEEKTPIIGCAIIERGPGFVIIKELLAEEQFLASAVKYISGHVPAEKYLVRTPAFLGKSLGGTVSAFGMLRINGEAITWPYSKAYLGIAFD